MEKDIKYNSGYFNNKYKVQYIKDDTYHEPQSGKLLFLNDEGHYIENKRKAIYFNRLK